MRMISCFSDAGHLIRGRPQPRSCFFEDAVLKDKVCHHFLDGQRLGAQDLDLHAGCLVRRITCQALLSRLEKFLRSAVIQALASPRRPAKTMRIFSSAL